MTEIESGDCGRSLWARWLRYWSPVSHSKVIRPGTMVSGIEGWVAEVAQVPMRTSKGEGITEILRRADEFVQPVPSYGHEQLNHLSHHHQQPRRRDVHGRRS